MGDANSASLAGQAATIPLSESNASLKNASGQAFSGWGLDTLLGAPTLPSYGSIATPQFGDLGKMDDVQAQATAQADAVQAKSIATIAPLASPAPASGAPATNSAASTADLPQVYIVGDEVNLGNSSIRQALQDALRIGDPQNELVTNSFLSAQGVATINKILASGDPSLDQETFQTNRSAIVGLDGKFIGWVNTKAQVVGDSSLGASNYNEDHLNTLGGRITVNGQQYCVAGTSLISPIKISLTEQNVQVNSTDHEKIKMEDGKIHTMSGGLNAGEAWLVQDTGGAPAEKNGIVNGKDVFGDHMGKFVNGYAQLAQDYRSDLKTDASGNQYIDLTDPHSLAVRQLKLMDRTGKEIPASSVLDRIYVSYAKTDLASADDRTFIKQEAQVQYKDGKTALSGDQWFSDASAPVPGV